MEGNYTHKQGIAWEHLQKYGYLKKRVAGGGAHTVGIMKDGTARACGRNDHGQNNVGEWRNLKEIACTGVATIGLRHDGSVCVTGRIPMGDHEAFGTPIHAWPNSIKSISASMGNGDHVLGLTDDGHVFAYGCNEHGQCNVSEWTDIVEIKALFGLSVGVRKDGTVVTCGVDSLSSAISQWRDVEHVFGAGNYELVVGLQSNGNVLVASTHSYFDTSQWQDIIDVFCDFSGKIIAGITGQGNVYYAGEIKNVIPSTLRTNILTAYIDGGAVYATSNDGSTWLGSLSSDMECVEIDGKVVAYAQGWFSDIMVWDGGNVQVVTSYKEMRYGQDQTEGWLVLDVPENMKHEEDKFDQIEKLEKKKKSSLIWAIVWLIICWPVSIYFFYKYSQVSKELDSMK